MKKRVHVLNDTQQIKKINRGPLTHDAVEAIYREIMSASISLQVSDNILLMDFGSSSDTVMYIFRKTWSSLTLARVEVTRIQLHTNGTHPILFL
jgi:hypothetical protein